MTKQDKPTMKIEEISKTKLKKLFHKYGLFNGGKEDGEWQGIEVKGWTGEKAIKMMKEIQEIESNLISTIRREAVGGITEQDMTDTIEAIDTIVNNDWGFDISLKLANKKEFTQEEAVQMGERIMDIYVLVHGFDTQCCKSSKAKLIQKLLSYKKVNNE